MKFLTIDFIKLHSRIEYNCEDELLELYGESAEETVLNILNRSYNNLIEEYGEVPMPIIQAALELVDHSYTQRAPASMQTIHAVPYTFDALVKPYMIL